ncbi:unnamed protein product [Knipowitschia caucasica]
MAEASVQPPFRFFCHICKSETSPNLPDLVCPKCDSDFIEEVEENSSLLQNRTTSQRQEQILPELMQMLFMECQALLSAPSSESEPNDGTLTSTSSSSFSSDDLEPIAASSLPVDGTAEGEEGSLEQFFSDLFTTNTDGVATSSPSDRWLQLHSNPGDYAWGRRGLDAVVTDLLGRLDNTGPPAADQEAISSLPTVCISEEHTDSRLDCPVCREDYCLGESVRQLPCLHYFHSDCIVPWLELHDTCPVCRKSLSGEDHGLSSSLSMSSVTSAEEPEEPEEPEGPEEL